MIWFYLWEGYLQHTLLLTLVLKCSLVFDFVIWADYLAMVSLVDGCCLGSLGWYIIA